MVNKILIKSVLLLIFINLKFSFAQKITSNSFYIKTYAHFGYIIEHRNNLGHLVNGHIAGAEFAYVKPSSGKLMWEHENNLPEKGVSVFAFTLGNPTQLGNLIAISPNFEIPFKSKPNKWVMHFRLGTGVAYVTKIFDPITNHKNNMISTHFNGFVNIKFLFKKDITDKYRLDFGISIAHASNGRIKVPNLGLNIASLNVALVFKTATQKNTENKYEKYIDSSTQKISKNEIYAIAGFGVTDIYPVGKSRFFVQTYSFGYYRNVRNTQQFGVGFDLFNNPANIKLNYLHDSSIVTTAQNIQFGVKFAWAYNIGRFSIPIEQGYYLKTAWKDDGNLYMKLGLRYYTKNNLIFCVGLKSHFARAEYFEYSIGYRFSLKNKK